MGLLDFIFDIFDDLWKTLCRFGKTIKKAIISFTKNIVSFFKDPKRLKKLAKTKKILATTIKENLDNGNVNVINCLYDTEKEQVIELEENAIGYENGEMDPELARNFGNKDMIILQ
ncbi:MAG: hypothetical protein IKA37_08300 [Spirochaetales bacterium]|nr:hypothetical protein [Spirochaetales bacterium]